MRDLLVPRGLSHAVGIAAVCMRVEVAGCDGKDIGASVASEDADAREEDVVVLPVMH